MLEILKFFSENADFAFVLGLFVLAFTYQVGKWFKK